MVLEIKDLINSSISGLTPYEPGKPLEDLEREYGIKNAVKLASNESPLGPSPKALKAIEDIAERYEKSGRKIKLRHLSRDCHHLLTRTGQLMIDSDDDPEYALAVDYDIRVGILGK